MNEDLNKEADKLFKKYSNLCQFEEGPSEYLMDSDDFKLALNEFNVNEAILFLNWCADNGWYRNGKADEWYQLRKQNENKTSNELYKFWKETL